MRFPDEQVLVSCEHATNRLPEGFDLDPEVQRLHVAWDPGARTIARRLAAEFDAPLHEGRYSRLVADLNRSRDNRMIIRRVSDGHEIPFNYGLDAAAREERIDAYWRPYRQAVATGVERIIAEHGRCVHLCIHTFTPVLADTERANDIGLLHDPEWGLERQVCRELRRGLEVRGDWVVWFNRPYSGTADGILPAQRRRQRPGTFVGIELEVNQRHASDDAELRRIADAFAESLREVDALAV